MKIEGARALVTGSNRGLGWHLAEQAVARGATVFGGVRSLSAAVPRGVTPVQVDITDPDSVSGALEVTGPINLLVNNAGASSGSSLLTGTTELVRQEFETNFFGPLNMVRTFAPSMAEFETSTILNVLSVLSWVSIPLTSAYCASKSAAWSMTNAARVELHGQGTRVCAVHVGFMDTDMVRHITAPKSDPADVARLALDAVAADEPELLADQFSELIRISLSGGVRSLYPQLGLTESPNSLRDQSSP